MFVRRSWVGILFCAACAVALAAEVAPEALLEGRHWKRLRSASETRLKANPNDAAAAYWLSNVKQVAGDLDGALALAEKAAALDPRSADYRCQVAELYGEKAEHANIFSQFGLARRFKKEADAAIALDAKHTDCRWALMEFHMRASGIVGGDKKLAQKMVDEILSADPARGHLAQGRKAQLEDSKTDLGPYYLKAIEANPRHYGARINLANYYSAAQPKKLDLSEKYARQAAGIDASRITAYNFLAGLYAFQERWQDMDALLAQAENNVPDNLQPYFQAGRQMLEHNKELTRAERCFRKYLSQEPELNAPPLAMGHWRLGQTLEKMGRKAEAMTEYEKAVKLDHKLDGAKKDLKRLR